MAQQLHPEAPWLEPKDTCLLRRTSRWQHLSQKVSHCGQSGSLSICSEGSQPFQDYSLSHTTQYRRFFLFNFKSDSYQSETFNPSIYLPTALWGTGALQPFHSPSQDKFYHNLESPTKFIKYLILNWERIWMFNDKMQGWTCKYRKNNHMLTQTERILAVRKEWKHH